MLIYLRLVKLDRRHKGSGLFTHRVEFVGMPRDSWRNFCDARSYLWKNFGESMELDVISRFYRDQIPDWAWDTNNWHRRLYLKDKALSQFLLIKEQFERERDD